MKKARCHSSSRVEGAIPQRAKREYGEGSLPQLRKDWPHAWMMAAATHFVEVDEKNTAFEFKATDPHGRGGHDEATDPGYQVGGEMGCHDKASSSYQTLFDWGPKPSSGAAIRLEVRWIATTRLHHLIKPVSTSPPYISRSPLLSLTSSTNLLFDQSRPLPLFDSDPPLSLLPFIFILRPLRPETSKPGRPG